MFRKFALAAALFCAASSALALPSPSVPTYNYAHISTNATTVVDNRPGVLGTICVNTKGASANVLAVYDNASAASGTVIATLDTTSLGCYTYNVTAKLGITVLTATGTAADVTVAWR